MLRPFSRGSRLLKQPTLWIGTYPVTKNRTKTEETVIRTAKIVIRRSEKRGKVPKSRSVLPWGTLVASEQKFLKPLIENARKNGYTRFIEPCAGAFAMSHIAAQSGYKPSEIEASDVAMFTSIMGYAITGQSLEELEIRAHGFTDEELLDPAVALYAQLYLRTVRSAGKEYFYNIMRDLECRKDQHIAYIREQLQRAHDVLNGMSYRPLDMWKHLEECYDDPPRPSDR